MKISKELLSEILGYEVNEILGMLEKGMNRTMLSYTFKDTSLNNGKRLINIYDLAHKCKEYLLDEGYYIVIHPFKVELFKKDTNSFIRDFQYPIPSKSMPYDIKRIVYSCQWILDNKKEGN